MNETTTESIEHLDFHFEIPCAIAGVECPAVATWRVVMACCGHVTFFCDEHMQLKFDIMAEGRPFRHIIGCGVRIDGNPYSMIERLK